MSCEFQPCNGYVVEHNEGETCLECNRVQTTIMQGPSKVSAFEGSDDEGTNVAELVFLVDRHIISPECSNHALRLFKKVRQMKINYIHIELVALVVCQSVFDIYGSVISLQQLCALFQSNIGEKSFLRKFAYLSKDFRNLLKSLKVAVALWLFHTSVLILGNCFTLKNRVNILSMFLIFNFPMELPFIAPYQMNAQRRRMPFCATCVVILWTLT